MDRLSKNALAICSVAGGAALGSTVTYLCGNVAARGAGAAAAAKSAAPAAAPVTLESVPAPVRAADPRGLGGPTGPLGTRSRTPWILSR